MYSGYCRCTGSLFRLTVCVFKMPNPNPKPKPFVVLRSLGPPASTGSCSGAQSATIGAHRTRDKTGKLVEEAVRASVNIMSEERDPELRV